ncbi:C39 family peptidase [Microcoleus sp. POL10_C6]|uniref:C39 family peptidase n=1 Tax=unclassified Microcoleus TaxID=2642155 RepID=UPI002FD0FCEA
MNTLEYTLRFKDNSVLKARPLDTSLLSPDQMLKYKAGEEIFISAYTPNLQGKYIRVYLDEFDIRSPETAPKQYYCFGDDVEISLTAVPRGESVAQQYQPVLPPKVDLKVPYHSQLNNLKRPSGACNVTCIAMVLKYYEVDSRTQEDIKNDVQLEDVLFRKTEEWDEKEGYPLADGTCTRHIPIYLQRLLREWGQKYGNGKLQNTYFKNVTSEQEIKQHLAKGNPVVIHGYFTNGHIIVIKGYDDAEGVWICNDPYGKWLGYQGGYDNNASGGDVRYTYSDLRAVWDVGGESWCHFPVP